MPESKFIGIFGMGQSGKSVLLNRILLGHPRSIVFDFLVTRGDHARANNFIHCTKLSEVGDIVQDQYDGEYKVWYQPNRNTQERDLHKLSNMLFDIQEPRVAKGQYQDLMLGIDELSYPFPVTKLSKDCEGFVDMCKTGRHMGINIVGASQAPAQVSTEFRRRLDVRYFLVMQEPNDRAACRKIVGEKSPEGAWIEDRVRILPKLMAIKYENGQFSELDLKRYLPT